MHEPQVFAQILSDRCEAVERYPVPETPMAPAFEQTLANHLRDRAIRGLVIHKLGTLRSHHSEALESLGLGTLDVRQDARIRSCVDQDPAGHEDSVHLV